MTTYYGLTAHPIPSAPSMEQPEHLDAMLGPLRELRADGLTDIRLDLSFKATLQNKGITNLRQVLSKDYVYTLNTKELERRHKTHFTPTQLEAVSSLYAVICTGVVQATEYSQKTFRSKIPMSYWERSYTNRALRPEFKSLLPEYVPKHTFWVPLTPQNLRQADRVETQNRLADTPVDPPTPEVPKPEPKSKTTKTKKRNMDTEEYVAEEYVSSATTNSRAHQSELHTRTTQQT